MLSAEPLSRAFAELAAALSDAESPSPEVLSAVAAEGARLLAAANLWRSLTPRLLHADSARSRAEGLAILSRHLRRSAQQRRPVLPSARLRAAQIAVAAEWTALAEAVERLALTAESSGPLIERADPSWQRARMQINNYQRGIQ